MRIRIGTVVALLALIALVFSTSTFAAGGKVRGVKGKGTVATGSTAKGTAVQPRTGR